MSKSKSSSAQTTSVTNTQQIETNTIGLEDVEFGIAGNEGDVSVVSISTDQGAIDAGRQVADAALDAGRKIGESAFDFSKDFGSEALETVYRTNDRALGTVERGLSDILDFGTGAVADAFDFARESSAQAIEAQSGATQQGFASLGSAIAAAGQATRSDTAATIQSLGKYGFIALSVIGAGVALYAFRRS